LSAAQPSLVVAALVIELRLQGVLHNLPESDKPTIDTAVFEALRSAVTGMQAQLAQACESSPALSDGLTPHAVLLERGWREIEELRQNLANGVRPAGANRSSLHDTPRQPGPSQRFSASEPSGSGSRGSKHDTPQLSSKPLVPPGFLRSRTRRLTLGGAIGVVVLLLAWEGLALLSPRKLPPKLQNIPAVKDISVQAGRAIVWVDESWTPDVAHVEALKHELAQRGVDQADVFNSTAKRLVELKMQLPPGVTPIP
jgi:hypothetical protein